MKVSIEDLEEMEDSAETTGQAAQQASEGMETPAGNTAQSAMEEFVEFKKAEMELQNVMQEESGSGLGEALTEMLKDPEIRQGLKTIAYGPDISEPELEGRSEPQPQPPQDVEPEATPEYVEAEAQPTEGYNLTSDELYQIMVSVLGDMAGMKPDMSIEQAHSHAEQFEDTLKPEIEHMMENLEK